VRFIVRPIRLNRLNWRGRARVATGSRSAPSKPIGFALRALRRALPPRTRSRSVGPGRDDVDGRACWLEIGREALAEFRRQPRARISLAQLCELIDLSSRFGRSATGMDRPAPPRAPECAPSLSFQEAMRKIYGPLETNPGGQFTEMNGRPK